LREDAIEIESPLVLLDFGQVAFYPEQATRLRELNGDSARSWSTATGRSRESARR